MSATVVHADRRLRRGPTTQAARPLLTPGDMVLVIRPYSGATPAIYVRPWDRREEWAELRTFPNGPRYAYRDVRPTSDLVRDTPLARAILRRSAARIDAALARIAASHAEIAALPRCRGAISDVIDEAPTEAGDA